MAAGESVALPIAHFRRLSEAIYHLRVTPDRWQRVKQLFEAALDQERNSREKFLVVAAADDPTLAEEVSRLLASDEKAGAFLSAPPQLPPFAVPTSLGGRYVIEREIGHGAMGRVFAGRDLKLGRDVAIKVLPAGARTADQLSRFEQEARAAGSLDHPNVLVVHDIGMFEGEPFIVSELLQGTTLRERLGGKALPPAEAVDYCLQLAQGLRAAHEKGIVHRDLKPENLFVTGEGRLKILDFGIAKLSEAPGPARPHTAEGSVIGTVDYMSPEQVRGESADGRSDIFACGSIVYEMLAARRPFESESVSKTGYAILNREPPPLSPEVPAPLARAVERCLAKRPEDRFQSAAELIVALTTAAASPAARPLRRWLTVVIAAAVPLAVLVVVTRQPQTRAERSSIAVIPFVNVSSDKGNEYLSDGITEELIDVLSNIDGLHVASRTSVFALKDKHLEARELGARLNVKTLLEGSVRREGNALRVTAQLVDVDRDVHLWSRTYERELKGIFALENEIAHSIAQALQRRLLGPSATSQMRASTTSIEAHDLYLRGRYFKEKRNAEALRRAAGYFEQALEKDPRYAMAWVGLADATALLMSYYGAPASLVLSKALHAVQQALELDPDLPEAHATLGMVAMFRYDWAGAEQALRRSIELKSDYSTAHHWYAAMLAWTGRHAEAQIEAERALQLEPTSLIINYLIGFVRYYDRDFPGAIAAYNKTLELEPKFGPSHSLLGWTYMAQGKYAEAQIEYDKGTPTWSEWMRGFTYGLSGHRSEALRVVHEMEERARTGYVSPAARGFIYLAIGAEDRAYILLQQACAENDFWLRQMKVEPLFDSFRKDSRFHDVLKCAHLE